MKRIFTGTLIASLGFLLALVPSWAADPTWVVFGPVLITRIEGRPALVTQTFSVLNPDADYTVRIQPGASNLSPQASVVVTLNGNRLVLPRASWLPSYSWPVRLLLSNQLTIELRGAPSDAVSVSVLGIDRDAPTITASLNPAPDDSGWNNGPVTVTFECSDQTSGIASCSPPATVTALGTTVVTGYAVDKAGNQTALDVTVKVASLFTVRNYGGKCLDAGPSPQVGGTVTLHTCNGSPGQRIRVEEMTASHQIRMHAGRTVIGFEYVGTPGDPSFALSKGPLTLQAETNGTSEDSNRKQFFWFDGDSLIAALDHDSVVQVDRGHGTDGTSIALRQRSLADSQLWDFLPLDGSGRDPRRDFVPVTTGFVQVSTVCELLRHVGLQSPGQPPENCPAGGPVTPAGFGSVIQIMPGSVLDVSGLYPFQLKSGVTIRGGRRGLDFAPRFCMALDCNEDNSLNVPGSSMFDVIGSDVRITGLNLEGPSRKTDEGVQTTRAVLAHQGSDYARTIIDHNDISGWTGAGVDVEGPDSSIDVGCDLPFPESFNVFVRRNFIHHNRQQEKGYGVVTGHAGFPVIEGNTFVSNRHAIASTGGGHTGYIARFNLVLSQSPLQDGAGPFNWHTHDFDQHGNGENGFGDRGGLYNAIYGNTFFGTNRANYEIRGTPCFKTDFRQNVSLQDSDDTVVFEPYEILPTQDPDEVVNRVDNHYNQANPTNRLGSGDFDADGIEDLFLATGAAWFYSPGGAREWRYLNAMADPISALRFGDFDGDGRTDVVTVIGGDLMVSWGAVSGWERLNASPGAISDLAVGRFVSDFSGDRRDDLFYSDGETWFLSSGGAGTFVPSQTSGYHVPDLRFGDFDGDGLTDVFRIVSDKWQVSYGATSSWTPLAKSLTTSMDGLVVSDFDGDGRADIGRASDLHATVVLTSVTITSWTWSISYAGIDDWSARVITPTSSCAFTFFFPALQQAGLLAGVAKVDDAGGADLVVWGSKDGNNFCVVSNGYSAAERLSSQDMR